MKKTLLALYFLAAAPLLASAEENPPQSDYLPQPCLARIQKLIQPIAANLTHDEAATVSDQGQPLQKRGATAAGEKIYFKPLWKVFGSVDGYYHLNAGAYLTFSKNNCRVLGVELTPELF